MDLVITHAGHNTTCESLAHGLPLLLLPIKDDQPIIAEQVKRAGAGLRLPFARVKSTQLREAVDRLLNEPQFREAASRLSADFRAMGDGGAGGASCVERALTELAEGSSSRD
jgi:UDP:flavonoid glycosyltransferase YjiC (YdhE family)